MTASLTHSRAVLGLILSAPFLFAQPGQTDQSAARLARAERARQRQNEFYQMRAWPGSAIPSGARISALREMERMIARAPKLHPHDAAPGWTLIRPRPPNLLSQTTPGGDG